jgi:Domain of unknown function (DUF4234)
VSEPEHPSSEEEPSAPAPPAPPAAAPSGRGPLGQPRGILFVILISIVTLGIYYLYWNYKTFEEMKQHTGEGVGGVLGLIIALLIGIVNAFLIPSEVGGMYKKAGRAAPMTGWTGLWTLVPLVGWFVWVAKVQGALNRYWESA